MFLAFNSVPADPISIYDKSPTAAVKAITNFRSTPGQQIINFFINQMTELTKQYKEVPFEIYKILGHQGIPGNEEANKLAKLVATQQCNITPSLCWGFAISILIGSAGTELKAKNISKKSSSYQKQFLTCVY